MAVQLTPYAPAYYLTPLDNGRKPPISTLELTALKKMNNPKYLGRVISEDYMDDSLFAELMAMGNEFTFTTDQVMWEEQEAGFNPTIVSGTGAVTLVAATGTFTINNAAIPVDPYNFDSGAPTDALWLQVKVGMEFRVFDSTGKTVYGKVTSVASDKKSFASTAISGDFDDLATTNLTVIFTGNSLGHCELAPCIGYDFYSPARENTMKKDSECLTYCEETEISNSWDGVDAQPLVKIGDEEYNLSDEADMKQKILLMRTENAFAFAERQASGGTFIGTNGVFPTLENRATKHLGYIETKADILNLFANMRSKKIKKALLAVDDVQYTKIMNIWDTNVSIQIDPSKDNTNTLYSIGFAGFRFGNEEIRFKRWAVMDTYPNIGKRYHWILIPVGKLKVKFNKRVTEAGYLNIGWFGTKSDVWKFRREEDRQRGGNVTIDYVNKMVPIILRPQDFMIGLTIA